MIPRLTFAAGKAYVVLPVRIRLKSRGKHCTAWSNKSLSVCRDNCLIQLPYKFDGVQAGNFSPQFNLAVV